MLIRQYQGQGDNDLLNNFINMISSSDEVIQLDGIIGVRKLLSNGAPGLIEEVINSGIVPTLLEFVQSFDKSSFQYESTWAIANIFAGMSKHVHYIIRLGGLDIILNLFNSPSRSVLEQAIWAIGNIAGDGPYFRDLCLKKGCLEALITAFNKLKEDLNLKKTIVWSLYNLVRGNPSPRWSKISAAISLIAQLLIEPNSTEILSDALWSLAYASDINAQEVINLGCIPSLIRHFNFQRVDDHTTVILPALRTLGNIAAGKDSQTDKLLECPDFLNSVFELTSHPKRAVRKEACWVVGNLSAGNPKQIALILDHPHYIEDLKMIIIQDEQEIGEQVYQALTNLSLNATSQQILKLVKRHDYLTFLGEMLESSGVKSKHLALAASLKVLKAANNIFDSIYYVQNLKMKAYSHILRLSNNDNKEVAKQADEVLKYLKLFDNCEPYIQNQNY